MNQETPQLQQPQPSLLQLRHLKKSYGGVQALDDVSFDLPAGQLLALLGPNGAGKSTCFNIINGQTRADAGEVLLAGRNIAGLSPRQIWGLGVGRTFQVATTFGSMTVLENVLTALLSHQRKSWHLWRPAATAAVYAAARDEAMLLLGEVGMAEQAGRASSALAYGDVKRLELAMALAHRPRLLLMDEPTAGMATAERHALMALTRRLVDERELAVLFTEHSMDVVFAFADHMVVLARGKQIASGDGETIRRDPLVQQVYFGSGKTFAAAGDL
ncbi:branched-chain amino acid transport system ATP-binding protein [Herbaspirillum sp. Sphag1AN]|uniref:ABC transporter ATP-binding protein n=1 Tax=unclassified Herbaspirillum TaxID=2624150 RepID=UPI0016086A30|nr:MULTISPECIES: ABC transporter ATP-binding protein [unclassified Herbaspirillum]MBB3212710.1 branched-chain amino acid transport system ATP-binding protein [Herbaspirillum sp. Sphag1AN]MBB3245907.1 branched-chain amino acid transport system ATP-binding protein [Herbaspirillum sp. Sphag64]